ncbi:TetR/AcrR family transcriptional regulator [Gordonia liuliyuniae]|uniref:TetR family transcriptional regulator n=1 Tax=Gordonia liuliyuniae TaxID=2911517 RepID=A0ABS9INV4_9ACTN|nr:TetR family transcriptional regulator [Gordonia liuliyuniae]MCF8587212.1 TetR family transcriptional regulator [Gordonia liuliyuniae]
MGDRMAKHDPAARRDAIVQAAADLIVEVGPGKLTHRLVAKRAKVPLGSTTAYFASLDELRQEALGLLVREIDDALTQIRQVFECDPAAAPDHLIDMLHDYLSERRNVVADVALSATATFDDQARELALSWADGLVVVLREYLGADNAHAVAMITEGAGVHAAIRGEALSRDHLRRALSPFIPASFTPVDGVSK